MLLRICMKENVLFLCTEACFKMDPSIFASFEGPEYNWKTHTDIYLLLLIGDLIDRNLFVTECGLVLSL